MPTRNAHTTDTAPAAATNDGNSSTLHRMYVNRKHVHTNIKTKFISSVSQPAAAAARTYTNHLNLSLHIRCFFLSKSQKERIARGREKERETSKESEQRTSAYSMNRVSILSGIESTIIHIHNCIAIALFVPKSRETLAKTFRCCDERVFMRKSESHTTARALVHSLRVYTSKNPYICVYTLYICGHTAHTECAVQQLYKRQQQ